MVKIKTDGNKITELVVDNVHLEDKVDSIELSNVKMGNDVATEVIIQMKVTKEIGAEFNNTDITIVTPGTHDGCVDCRYFDKYDEYPCTECCQNYVDRWRFKRH